MQISYINNQTCFSIQVNLWVSSTLSSTANLMLKLKRKSVLEKGSINIPFAFCGSQFMSKWKENKFSHF